MCRACWNTRTRKRPPQQRNTTPSGKAPRPAADKPRGAFSLAVKQTAKRSRNTSARFPARPPRVFCVFFEQQRRQRSPLVVAHYQAGGSIGRRRACAQRAHHSFDGQSRARRARLATMRGSVALRVRDHVTLACHRSPRSTRSPSSRSRRRVKIHVSFHPQAAASS